MGSSAVGAEPLKVLYLDAHLLAVDKPAGRIVIPGRGAPERTLQDEAAAAHGRLWIVHRLDRGTSGVLLFARTPEAHRAVNLAFDRGEPAKRYLAIVRGEVPVRAVLDSAIAAGRRGRMRAVAPDDPRGKRARTEIRLLESFPERPPLPALSFVEATPRTGRTHQIRVHLASAGAPLAVDPEYGEAGPLRDGGGAMLLARTPLHAASLELLHPASGRALRIEAPLAPDLAVLLARLRSGT